MKNDTIDSCPDPVPKYEFCRDADWWKTGISYSEVADQIGASSPPLSRLELEFTERADRWENDSAIHSSPSATYFYRDYLAIIGSGITAPDVIVPLILKRIPNSGADWFFALETIAGENPASESEAFEDAYGKWCDWAEQKGFLK